MKDFFNKNKIKLIAAVVIIAALTAAFYFGGNTPGSKGWTVDNPQSGSSASMSASEAENTAPVVSAQPEDNTAVQPSAEPEQTAQPSDSAAPEEQKNEEAAEQMPEETPEQSSEENAEQSQETAGETETEPSAGTPAETAPEETPAVTEIVDANGNVQEIDPETGKDKYNTDPVPEGRPVPVEPQEAEKTDEICTCTISISCATILDNMDYLDPEKVELVPEDGWLLKPVQVSFSKGESVFDVLLRTVQEKRIHMEYSNTPMYNSAYIEGIGNLYEFDCGELSGWMYKVNEWFPNYGCSRYQLEDGDVICWEYTCDLGYDVGGGYAVGR